ncbi:MAG: hypothetical protein Q7S87_03345 [Agitococcus sp.]|nr:hypothetical protein [Agitococcus sp.]MDO9178671.1 hypothetical protein [Agitococcus sp.]
MSELTYQPSITFLNMSGDVTLTWDASNEAAMLARIEAKMAAGFTFFILKPRLGGLLSPKKVPLTSIAQAKKAGAVTAPDALANTFVLNLGDADVNAMVSSGIAQLSNVIRPAQWDTIGRANTAKDVLTNQTIATRAIVGG